MIKIWDLNTGQCVKTLRGHEHYVISVIELNGGYLASGSAASGSADGSIKIWDIKNGQCVKTLRGHAGTVTQLIQLNDRRLASGSADKTIKIWGDTKSDTR